MQQSVEFDQIMQTPQNKDIRVDPTLSDRAFDEIYQNEFKLSNETNQLHHNGINVKGRIQEQTEQENNKHEANNPQQSKNISGQNGKDQNLEQKNANNEKELRFDDVDFEQNCGLFSRLIFVNLVYLAVNIKKALNRGLNLTMKLIPKIKETHRVESVTDSFYEDLQKLKAANNFKPYEVFKKCASLYTRDIWISLLMVTLDAVFKLFNSVALNFCIQELINKNQRDAYIWGGVVILSMLLSATFRHGSWMIGQNIFSRARLLFVNIIYRKISKLSSYSIKEANLGKVINLVSSDLNSTELKGFFLFNMIVAPIIFIFTCVILYFRLGPFGLLSVVFLSLVFPMQNYYGKKSSVHTQQRTLKSDERVKLINEAIEGIRLIKMYGWESAFRQMVERIRNLEIIQAIKSSNYQNAEKAFSRCLILFVAAIIFCIIYYNDYELNSAKIFSTIEILQFIRVNVMLFSGMGISYLFELRIFLNRFIDILSIDETEMTSARPISQDQKIELSENEVARFDQFNAYWKSKKGAKTDSSEQNKNSQKQNLVTETEQNMLAKVEEELKPVLKNINLVVKQGELLGVVGKIGSGKTTFLQCFLREIPMYEGGFQMKGGVEGQAVAYVEQEPYIFSSTVRENILFGKQYEEIWYNQVVKQCCLLPDFKEMAKGDQTEIGERGINISGGQKARISLARAVYSNADIYLLDDPLSAVDSKVAKKLFHNCIKGILQKKTVILVTHQIHYTKNCDRIILFEEGLIKEEGTFQQLEEDLKKLAAGQLKFETSSNNSGSKVNSLGQEIELVKETLIQDEETKKKEKNEAQNKLQPKLAQDNVKVTYKTYARFIAIINKEICGFPVILLFLFVASEVCFTTFNRALGYYDTTSDDKKGNLFGFLFGFSFLFLLLNLIKYILLASGILKGSRLLHNQMFKSLTRAPVLFFDQTPGGYLMNKFSNDISIVDNALQYSANDGLDILFYLCNLMITCCVINPYVIIPAIVELFVLYKLLIYSKDMIIKTKILDLTHKSPVFQFFQSTLSGVIPIKIYHQKNNFLNKMQTLCNNSTQTNITYWLAGRFFGVFVQFTAIIGSAVGIFIIIAMSSNDPSLAAQSLTYFMMMTDSVQWCLRQMLNVDSVMSSCERGYQMIDQSSEASLVTEYDIQQGFATKLNLAEEQEEDNHVKTLHPSAQPPANSSIWPKEGNLEFQNVFMKYSKELNPVLKGLNFTIKQGQKVGCIGRTGAGKSSILQALFRMTEIEEGSKIIFDGQDTSKLGLHTLRSKISIIPQVPFVFAGTIRRNLDPLGHHSEQELWESLKLVELDQHVMKNCPQQLNTDMTNVQSVFSVGQKQLICLARAILKRNKLLVLDEATANVDMETDNLIQKTIREKFDDSSVLTIAHRLNTISDYDKVIVMDEGIVAECDEPFNLLANTVHDTSITRDTMFAQMVQHTGKNNAMNIFNNAKDKYMQTHKDEEF